MSERGGEVVLGAEGLERRFRMGGHVLAVLRGVDLRLRLGEAVAIMGRSGSGKSTLLHCLGLLDRPDAGRLVVAGRDVTGLGARARARVRNRHVGFVFQFYHLLHELSALENALLPLRMEHGPAGWLRARRAARARTLALFEELGIAERARHRPAQLSGGERQRVAIARALVAGPRILLCDEPTGNLDERTSERITELLFGLRARHGFTLVLVTHDEDLARCADRTLVLSEGRLDPEPQVAASETR